MIKLVIYLWLGSGEVIETGGDHGRLNSSHSFGRGQPLSATTYQSMLSPVLSDFQFMKIT